MIASSRVKAISAPLNLSKIFYDFVLEKEKSQIYILTYRLVCLALSAFATGKTKFLKLKPSNAVWNMSRIQVIVTITSHFGKQLMYLFFWNLLIICAFTRKKGINSDRKVILFGHVYIVYILILAIRRQNDNKNNLKSLGYNNRSAD